MGSLNVLGVLIIGDTVVKGVSGVIARDVTGESVVDVEKMRDGTREEENDVAGV